MPDRSPTLAPRHRAVLAPGADRPIDPDRRPRPGAIAILPESDDLFAQAVTAAGGEVAPLGADTTGIVWLSYRRATELADVLAANPQIEWVQLPWAGVDAFSDILAKYADAPLPLWTSAKGAYAQPVAEHALMLALALLRVIPTRVRATTWSNVAEGRSLYGMNVVIIGAGGIAIELARLLEPFGVRLTVVRRSSEPFVGAERTLTADRLADALPDADVVFVAAAMTDDTSKLVGEPELRMMKSTAVLVNVARGGLVDTDAITKALAHGWIDGAGLDVTDPEPLPDGHPLWDEPRVIITPHSADTPEMTAPLLRERVRLNVEAFLGHGRFVGVVDPGSGY
jgi:phosphoglycerate dehydrogenase-like enzyme